jgi:hypothetical protein
MVAFMVRKPYRNSIELSGLSCIPWFLVHSADFPGHENTNQEKTGKKRNKHANVGIRRAIKLRANSRLGLELEGTFWTVHQRPKK